MPYTYVDVAKTIDHSLLQPFLSTAELDKGIALARAYDVASVCILPWYLPVLAERLADCTVVASTVIGFPHGGHLSEIKIAEARRALAQGAAELDMVVNVSAVKSGEWGLVASEIREIVAIAHGEGGKVKVIFENAYLTDEEKIRLCLVCGEIGADWVKTSTGYAPSGATTEDLVLMRKHSPEHVQVKAAGGVRDLDRLLEVRAIGATRCGASATAAILDEARRRLHLEPIEVEAGPVGSY